MLLPFYLCPFESTLIILPCLFIHLNNKIMKEKLPITNPVPSFQDISLSNHQKIQIISYSKDNQWYFKLVEITKSECSPVKLSTANSKTICDIYIQLSFKYHFTSLIISPLSIGEYHILLSENILWTANDFKIQYSKKWKEQKEWEMHYFL